ncbi:MAG: hypothetical protein U0132_04200 [Gemmatimonadaceae bacterium]
MTHQSTNLAEGVAAHTVATPRAELTTDERADMYRLLQCHFEGVTPTQFNNDLAEKDWALRIFHGQRLVGFTTLQLYETTVDDTRVCVVYSGDTIVAREAWGSPTLARGWIRLVRSLKDESAPMPWYWLLLSSGFRTYRFLPVFWREFWPRHDADTPAHTATLLQQLARARFGPCFDAARGVVRFAHPQRLRDHLAGIPDGRELDPHAQFFFERNPGHADGDELVCLTELSDENLTRAGCRMVRNGAP